MQLQNTIAFSMSCYGFGLHSGKMSQVTLKPAAQDQGIVFIRTDVANGNNVINVTYDNIVETTLATTIANKHKISIATIEHLMAALYYCGIDNIIIEVDGPEIPIMDGSSRPFVFLLQCAGIQLLKKKKKQIRITRTLRVEHNDSYITVEPAESFQIETSIDFNNKSIGYQHMIFDKNCDFNQEIASARTFGFLSELQYLNSKGLGLGVNLQNAVGINEKDEVITPLRYKDEFVRHKILDAIGDFYTLGNIEAAKFRCHKSGHYLNNQILRQIMANSNNYEIY